MLLGVSPLSLPYMAAGTNILVVAPGQINHLGHSSVVDQALDGGGGDCELAATH